MHMFKDFREKLLAALEKDLSGNGYSWSDAGAYFYRDYGAIRVIIGIRMTLWVGYCLIEVDAALRHQTIEKLVDDILNRKPVEIAATTGKTIESGGRSQWYLAAPEDYDDLLVQLKAAAEQAVIYLDRHASDEG